jgi:NAD(P)-dependent dehydrogenase (short-subunit alcohol dehydrogenase family)
MPVAAARTILLTGATRGLGRALVGEFTARGHTVWGCGRSAPLIANLRREFPAPHDWSVVDVTDAGAVDAWAQRLLATGTAPDLLLNNAALINRPAAAWAVPRGEFDALVDVNLKGVANVIRAFVPAMVKRKRGVIVNFSSGWGRSVSPEVAPYCMSKWAMEGLSKAMAEEIPSGMAVVPLNPGVIDTEMLRTCWGEAAGHYVGPEPWARAAAPYLLALGPKDNGRSVTVPGVPVD